MNKQFYKQTFSGIYPSDEAIERIFDMTEKKTKRIRFKAMIVVAAIIAIFTCATLTANAVTDGALFSGMKMILNGEEVDIAQYIKDYQSYTDENGVEIEKFEVVVPDEDGNSVQIFRTADDEDVTLTEN